MRRVEITAFCDACDADETETPATTTYTVAAVGGEASERAVLAAVRTLDLCERHTREVEAVRLLASEHGARLGTGPGVATRFEPRDPGNPLTACPLCETSGAGRSAIVQHVWKHHVGQPKPTPPTMCPDCNFGHRRGEPKSTGSVGVHRAAAHGFDPLAEAVAAAKAVNG